MYYNIDGLSLKAYCDANNLSYTKMYRIMKKLLIKNPYKTLNDLLPEIMVDYKKYEDQKNRYFKDEMPLEVYCKNNNLPYNTVVKKIVEFSSLEPGLTDEELVDKALEYKRLPAAKIYKINGRSAIKICTEENLNYDKFLVLLNELKLKEPSLSETKASIMAYEILKSELSQKIYYKGVELEEYCKKMTVNYNEIIIKLEQAKHVFKSMLEEELIECTIHNVNPKEKLDELLHIIENIDEYCLSNNIEKDDFLKRIEYNLYLGTPLIMLLNLSKTPNFIIGKEFSILNYLDNINLDIYIELICQIYNISIEKVNESIETGLSRKESILKEACEYGISINL
ncbi:MAG: hypothetical protein R3Y13_00230 [bacterium]